MRIIRCDTCGRERSESQLESYRDPDRNEAPPLDVCRDCRKKIVDPVWEGYRRSAWEAICSAVFEQARARASERAA